MVLLMSAKIVPLLARPAAAQAPTAQAVFQESICTATSAMRLVRQILIHIWETVQLVFLHVLPASMEPFPVALVSLATCC